MSRRAQKQSRKQVAPTLDGSSILREMVTPIVVGMMSAQQTLIGWVRRIGLAALEEVFRADAEQLAGPKGKHRRDRQCHRWGTTGARLGFGGRTITVNRPRVRTRGGRELGLPTAEQFQATDPLSERLVERLLLGVSTRGYEASLEGPVPAVKSRGASKSAASRRFCTGTRRRLAAFLARPLDAVAIVALMLAGLEVAGHTVVVALGISASGKKVTLGLWLG